MQNNMPYLEPVQIPSKSIYISDTTFFKKELIRVIRIIVSYVHSKGNTEMIHQVREKGATGFCLLLFEAPILNNNIRLMGKGLTEADLVD